MANNVAASMKASIIIDKKEIISSALSAYAEAQKEIAGNKIELLVDVSDDKARERLKEISKELAGKDYVIKFKNQGIEETMKSLDELFGRIKDVINLSNGISNSISKANNKQFVQGEIDAVSKLKDIVNKTTITFEDFKTIIANLPSDKIGQLNKMLGRTFELTSDVGTSLGVMTSELGKYFTITGTRSSTSFFLSNEGEFTRKPNKNKTNFVDDEIYTKGMKYDPSDLADFAMALQKQEQQAIDTAKAQEKLAETEKNLGKSTIVDNSKLKETIDYYREIYEIQRKLDDAFIQSRQLSLIAAYDFDSVEEGEKALNLCNEMIAKMKEYYSLAQKEEYSSNALKEMSSDIEDVTQNIKPAVERALSHIKTFTEQRMLDNEIGLKIDNSKSNAPKELLDEYISVISKINNGFLDGQEGISILNTKAKELGVTFDETSRKWVNVAATSSSGDINESSVQIDKLKNKLDELSKRYEELSKSTIVSGKDIDLVDNEEFQKLSKEFATLKQELSDIKIHMELFEQSVMSYDAFIPYENQISELSSRIEKLINDYHELAIAQKDLEGNKSNISSGNEVIESQNKIQEELKETDEIVQKILYHYGLLSSYNGGKKSHQFGDEIAAYKEGKRNGNRGWADGTGTYVTNDVSEFKGIVSEDFKKFFALDVSKLKLYEAHIEQEAEKFYNFQHKLEQFVLALGSGYSGFDENISDVTSESLYKEAQEVFAKYPKIFKEVFKDFDDFDSFIDKMINLVSESGMNENGFESKNAKKLMEFKKKYGIDDIKTRFLKELGFQGTDLSGTSYGGIKTGSVIFDIETAPVLSSAKTIQEVLDAIGVKAEDTKYKINEIVDVQKDVSSTPIKDTFQGDKIEQATTSAKELDKILEQAVDVPTDKFDEILSKLDLTESKLGKIARITKQMHIDENGKPVESYTLKDKHGSTEIYGESSNKATKQLLSANYVEYDSKQAEKEAKELLAVEKEITKEIEKQEKAQASAQKKKWQAFESEQKKYVSDQKKTTDIEKNKPAYQELLDTIKQYSEVSKRIAKNETLDGDLELAQKLENKISELQKNPILSSSQIAKSERDLVNLFNQLDTLEKKTTKKKSDKSNAQSAKEQAEAWEKNVKAIQEYMDANTKLNNLKAQDAGTGKKAKEIEYQTKEVKRLEKVALEARATLSSMINPHDVPISDWNKWLDVMKQFDQATEGSAESLAKLEDSLRNMAESQFKKVNDTLSNSEKYLELLKPTEGNRSVSFEKVVQEYDRAVNSLKEFHATLDATTPLTKEQSDKFEKLANDVKKARIEIDKIPKSQRGSDEDSRMKEIDKLTKYLDANTRISKEAKQQLQGYLALLKSGDPSVSVKELHTAWTKVAVAEREAGREGKRFFDIISDKALYGQAAQLAGYYLSLTDFIRYGKQAVDTIIELDTALIDLKKTTAMSGSEMENFYFEANDVAKEMGVTTQAIIEQSSAWSRLGYNTKEASTEMAKLSSKFATISPGMDTDTAQEGLVSIMKAWDIDVDQVESEVIDKINTLGNNFAEENQDIVEGMKRSAAALASTGTTYQDAFALFTGAQEVLQNSEVTGRALRSISMRIHGYSENSEDGLAELDEELTNITGDLIDLTKTAEHTQGVSIFKDGSTTEFKSLVDYFGEINAIWDEMSQKQQNDFLQMAFGKTQAQAGAALIQNYESVVGALEKMEQSAGSADAEMAAVESSLNYKINSLKETWVGTVQEMIDRGDLGVIIDGLVKLSEAIGFVLDKAGLLGTAGIIGGGILGVKNAGICV